MSYCSSDGGTPNTSLSRSRKSSWLIQKVDENEIDKEVQEKIDEWRNRGEGRGHVECIQMALEYCRAQLKELLMLDEMDKELEEGRMRSKPIDIHPGSEEHDVLGNLVNCLDRQQKAARQQMYFDKIVQLGLERQAIQDESSGSTPSVDECRAEGHEFVMQPVRGGHNPCCEELRRVNELRHNFLLMKCYFVSCRSARRLRILQYLQSHSHFVDNAEMYSMKELRELCDGTLLPELEQIHTVFRKHIEEDCETCAGNGFFCELCDDSDTSIDPTKILYPFTENTRACSSCLAVYHRKCFERKSLNCPRYAKEYCTYFLTVFCRCERRRRRSEVPKTLSSSDEKEAPVTVD
ncbi:hypothetical protein CAEBREN_12942 [Caenorhabditis brenneri]|uniref:Rubicon Homology domain-containing protein n=1 Tax=Caenorhabditis brenneri TaxID=135651 RepID=G0MWZ7_CAEBE|nr:hypothetical protein CAEBREN_12942 [Caenorhabditis brenneri]